MSNHVVISNYISRCHTSYSVYHIYHSNVILFGSHELSELIFPGLFHELKHNSKYPEMFDGAISAPSLYQLPRYISPTKLTEQLRTDLADGLLFIHTWCEEHFNQTIKDLLEVKYDTYEEFFNTMLMFIISLEPDDSIRDLAIDIKTSIKKISIYLGPYHGNLRNSVFNKQNLVQTIILLLVFVYLFSGFKDNTQYINKEVVDSVL